MSEVKETKKPKEERKGVVLFFPLIKKMEEEVKLDPDNEPAIIAENLAKMTVHYTDQMTSYLLNHGIEDSKAFRQDMEFMRQVMQSTIARAIGTFHPLQEYIDEMNLDE